MIDVQPPVEGALLIGAPRKGTADARSVDEHLDELARLADTAGARVAGRVVQFIAAPTPDLYIGRGKAAEVAQRVNELGATLVIFDEELSPRQGKHLEDLRGPSSTSLRCGRGAGKRRCRSSWRSSRTCCRGSRGCGRTSRASAAASG